MRLAILSLAVLTLAACGRSKETAVTFAEPELMEQEAFVALGLHRAVDVETADFHRLWTEELKPFERALRARRIRPGWMGIFHSREKDGRTGYLMAVTAPREADVPEGCRRLEIPAATWAIFRFSMDDIGKAWDHVHGDWLKENGTWRLDAKPVIEYYPEGCREGDRVMAIYVPVVKR